ncbi:hypothetical protein IC235_11130 [Hymenobacter sp. BT664]|uniref:Uncharacterized protein n=1 Tax=Hymenobacter montanus TaxID=2771359 RepID=A0A927BCT8_9BACT|nr:hypothetical protein [Hymenobacter montanus]MBD2768442.1 hypothetical protein [Hymenobacter montanus]
MTTELIPIVGPQARKSLLTIQKATVKKQLLYAEFTEQLDLQAKPRPFTMQSAELVHPDLERCFAHLVPHFCLLTEQLDEHAEYDTPAGYWPMPGEPLPVHFDSYGVTGLIIGAKNGVTLMGFRQLESGKVLNMTGQYVSFAETSEEFEESDAWHYQHTDELQGAVEVTLEEVEAALRGKCSEAGRQLDMFVQEKEVEMGERVEEQPTKKRKARRNTATTANAAE